MYKASPVRSLRLFLALCATKDESYPGENWPRSKQHKRLDYIKWCAIRLSCALRKQALPRLQTPAAQPVQIKTSVYVVASNPQWFDLNRLSLVARRTISVLSPIVLVSLLYLLQFRAHGRNTRPSWTTYWFPSGSWCSVWC